MGANSQRNPYDRNAGAGSILKIEDVNYTDKTRTVRRPLYAYVISAKRYALFTLTPNGRPVVVDDGYREHGLGHLLNPTDPNSEDRAWIRQVWEGIVTEALGGPGFEPSWGDRPALMKSAVTTPGMLRRFERINRGKPYAAGIKPFNFLLSAHVAPLNRPAGAKACHLIAPFERDARQWLRQPWIDLHSGRTFRIRTDEPTGPRGLTGVRVQPYADVLDRYRMHPEPKSVGSGGSPSDETTIGLLSWGDDHVLSVRYIGKETNLIEQREEGVLLVDPQAVYVDPGDPAGWEAIREWLRRIPATHIAALSGRSASLIRYLGQGQRRPSHATREAVTAAVIRYLNTPPDAATLDTLESAREAKRGRSSRNGKSPRRRWRIALVGD